eukprot:sb/3475460/
MLGLPPDVDRFHWLEVDGSIGLTLFSFLNEQNKIMDFKPTDIFFIINADKNSKYLFQDSPPIWPIAFLNPFYQVQVITLESEACRIISSFESLWGQNARFSGSVARSEAINTASRELTGIDPIVIV